MALFEKLFRKPDTRDIRYVICDIDGTLIGRSGIMPQSTVKKLLELRDAGIRIFLATGRSDFALQDMIREISIESPVISLDGSLARRRDEIFHCTRIESKAIAFILDESAARYNISVVAMTPKGNYVSGNNYLPSYLQDDRIPVFETDRHGILQTPDIMRIYLSGDRANIGSLNTLFKQKGVFSGLELTSYESRHISGIWFLEIKPRNATKGEALKALMKKLGIKKKSVAGIGDYRNDVSMLKACGYRVAMKDAVSELKEHADFITSRTADEAGSEEFFNMILASRNK